MNLSTERGVDPAMQNRILRRMSLATRVRLAAALVPVRLAPNQILYRAKSPIEHIYFVTSGWASLVVAFQDGFQAEVTTIGREGMVGLPIVHGTDLDTTEAIVRIPSEALRMRASALREEIDRSPEIRRELLKLSDAKNAEAKQISACNVHHTLEKRLARSLLIMCDASDSRRFPISQETLASMLCVHRPSLTAAAGRLQRRGLIRQASGVVEIVDHRGLEAAACECYGLIRTLYR